MNFQSYIASLIRNPNQTWVFKPYKPLRLNGSTTLPNVGVGLFWFLSSEKHGKHASFMNHESCLFTRYECTWDCLNCITCWGPKVNYVNLYCLHRSVRLPMENTIEPLISFCLHSRKSSTRMESNTFLRTIMPFQCFLFPVFFSFLFFILYFILYIYHIVHEGWPYDVFYIWRVGSKEGMLTHDPQLLLV